MITYDIYNEYSCEDYLKLLSQFTIDSDKISSFSSVRFTFVDANSLEAIEFRKFIGLPETFTDAKNINTVISIMNWFKDKFNYSRRATDINQIGYLFDDLNYKIMLKKFQDEEYPFLPKYESLFFTYVLLSLGYKARWVVCLPIDTQHLFTMYVTEIYLEDKNKWIALDIWNNCLYCDDRGEPLNLIEMRMFIIKNNHLIIYNLNGKISNDLYEKWVRCLFKFKFTIDNTLDMLTKNSINHIMLVPKLFVGQKKTIFDYSNNKHITYDYCNDSSLVYTICENFKSQEREYEKK